MRHFGMMGIALVLALAIGCGKSDEQKAAETAPPKRHEEGRQKRWPRPRRKPARGGHQRRAWRRCQGAGRRSPARWPATGPDGKPVEPVSFQAAADGASRGVGLAAAEPTGERMTTPDRVLANRGDYTMGDSPRSR